MSSVKSTEKKKQTGLGRGLESLLDDNSPVISGHPQVVKRGEAETAEYRRASSNSLYSKGGTVSHVEKTKWSRS